jgi:hypothetical protein
MRAHILKSRALIYAEGVRKGGTLVIARAAFGTAEQTIGILDEHDPIESGIPEAPRPVAKWDPAAPLSSALHWPVLLRDSATFSDFWNVPLLSNARASLSRWLGIPLLVDDPAPMSSRFGLALLTGRAAPLSSWLGWRTLSDDPAPLSAMLKLPTLTKGRRRT